MTKFAILCLLALASNSEASRRRPVPDADAAMSSPSPSASQQHPTSRSSPHYTPVNPELSYLLKNTPVNPELAALARAAREHRTRGRSAVFVPSPQFDPRAEGEAINFVARPQQASSVGEQTEFRPSQPTRPVYHATPLHQFGVQEPVDEREAANYVVQTQQETGQDQTGGQRTEFRPRQPIRPVYHAVPIHRFSVKQPVEDREATNYVRPQQQQTETETTASSGEQPMYQARQPITPVYHATPLRPFGVLLDTADESRDVNSFAAPASRGVAAAAAADDADADSATTGGSMGRLTEAIFPGRGGGKHSMRVAVVEARSHEHEHADEQANTGGAYEFGYAVRDERGGNFFGHSERRDALGTSGTYHVFLPDGRLQSVKYTADHDGFHAHVSYKRPDLKE